jgi:hypothetical protein
VRHVRVNDLIDPQAPPLCRPYGAVVRSQLPLVIQLPRQAANSVTVLPPVAVAGGVGQV